ncbi:hypothetical protein [Clostridium polynesiense]|nr:hypothetical protein [Clostridium polynesiense]
MDFKEIGETLELSESTVKTRYYSLSKNIKSAAEEEMNNEG